MHRAYAPTRPLIVLHQGQSQWFSPLLAAAMNHNLPLFVHSATPSEPRSSRYGSNLEAALAGLGALNLAGAVLEDPGLQVLALDKVENLEAEAQTGRRVDLVLPESTGPRGFYLEPLAFSNLLRRHALGDRAVWVGPVRAELAQGLRGLSKVSVLSRSYPEGEGFLGLLPAPQRGVVGVAELQAEVVAREADTVIYAGGPLPLTLLQPYHTLIGLKSVPAEALRLVGEYLPPEAYLRFHLAALLEPLGYSLPPEAFGV
ncbi:hypothetical protein [Meiothermus granaticius]|uniref:Uncharacterized protein n=1 Tax=Meiothermus granaticius NBRC 107808 TaxID=1227551 RepID=A0A399F7D1_9DEIN|nr:hypothetical protein [Meiothermus granaticius]MCL6525917.1 hypothetical protein [Thermaceae bacterium]RIH91566.1 hypothetical protein Mgrana_02506 [Meiothermus granaticius NBRC 107808]GEM85449.1 hypothetical protein MGR01S_00740 [Meiothermus granaticius NBRC 107808]